MGSGVGTGELDACAVCAVASNQLILQFYLVGMEHRLVLWV